MTDHNPGQSDVSIIHRRPEQYICLHPGCEVTFGRVYDLKRHITKHVPKTAQDGYFCPEPHCIVSTNPTASDCWNYWVYTRQSAWRYETCCSEASVLIRVFGCPRKDKLINHLRKNHDMNDDDIAHVMANVEPQPPIQFRLTPSGSPVGRETAGSVYVPPLEGFLSGYYLLEMTKGTLQPEEASTTTPAALLFEHNTVFYFGDTGIWVTTRYPRSREKQEFFYPDIEIDPWASLRALLGPRNYVSYE